MDGIFGVDMAAIACLREAKLRKLKVPEELSIVSIDVEIQDGETC